MIRILLAVFLALSPLVAQAQTALGGGALGPVAGPTLPLSQANGGNSYSPSQLNTWRACLAKATNANQAGTGGQDCIIVMAGDSTTFGIGSTANSGNGNQLNLGDFLSLGLNEAGIPANNNGFCGNGSTVGDEVRVASTGNDDSRFTGTGWNNSSVIGFGGALLSSTTNSSSIVFTPISSYNSAAAALYADMRPNVFKVDWINISNAGTMTVQATGGTLTTLSGTPGQATPVVTTTNISASASSATNALTITATSVSGGPYLECIRPVNTSVSGIDIVNAGMPGNGSADWIANTDNFTYLPMISYLAPSLVIFSPGINDWDSGMPAQTFRTNIDTFLSYVTQFSSVILMSPVQNTNNTALQAQYIDVEKAEAAKFNIPFIDQNALMGTPAQIQSNGLCWLSGSSCVSPIHPNSPGYAMEARALIQAIVH